MTGHYRHCGSSNRVSIGGRDSERVSGSCRVGQTRSPSIEKNCPALHEFLFCGFFSSSPTAPTTLTTTPAPTSPPNLIAAMSSEAEVTVGSGPEVVSFFSLIFCRFVANRVYGLQVAELFDTILVGALSSFHERILQELPRYSCDSCGS